MLSATPLCAQSDSVRLSVVTVDSQPTIRVHNLSSRVVAGFVVSVDMMGSPRVWSRIYYDPYVNWEHEAALAPGSNVLLPLPQIEGGNGETVTTLQAVVFADGSHEGDTKEIEELLARRQVVFDRLNEVTAFLREVGEQKIEKNGTLVALEHARSGRAQMARGQSFELRRAQDFVYLVATRKLDGGVLFNGKVPEFSKVASYVRWKLTRWRDHLKTAKPSVSHRPDGLSWRPPPVNSQVGSLTLASFKASSRVLGNNALVPSPSPKPIPACQVVNASYESSPPDTCGNTLWQLRANVGGMYVLKHTAWSYGACGGGFTQCNGQWRDPYIKYGGTVLRSASAPPDQVGFYWELDRWTAIYSDCDCTDPNPDGHWEDWDQGIYLTPTYYASCP